MTGLDLLYGYLYIDLKYCGIYAVYECGISVECCVRMCISMVDSEVKQLSAVVGPSGHEVLWASRVCFPRLFFLLHYLLFNDNGRTCVAVDCEFSIYIYIYIDICWIVYISGL